MNEWLAPLIGFLVFLFFCPGVFVWVYLTNRTTATVEKIEPRAKLTVRPGRTPKILKPVTTLLVLGVLSIGCGISLANGSTVTASRPKGRTCRTLPAKTIYGTGGKRIESIIGERAVLLPADAAAEISSGASSHDLVEHQP